MCVLGSGWSGSGAQANTVDLQMVSSFADKAGAPTTQLTLLVFFFDFLFKRSISSMALRFFSSCTRVGLGAPGGGGCGEHS